MHAEISSNSSELKKIMGNGHHSLKTNERASLFQETLILKTNSRFKKIWSILTIPNFNLKEEANQKIGKFPKLKRHLTTTTNNPSEVTNTEETKGNRS